MNILIMVFLLPIILGTSIVFNINMNKSMLDTAGQATQNWENEMEQQMEL